jgi:hypothetical protein
VILELTINSFPHEVCEFARQLTNIGLLQGRRIVDTITSDSHNGSHALATLNNDQLLLGRGTGEHNLSVVPEDFIEMVGAKFTQFGAVDDSGLGFTRVDLGHGDVQTLSNIFNSFVALGDDSDGLGNSLGSDRVITSNHDNLKAQFENFSHMNKHDFFSTKLNKAKRLEN